MVKTFNEYLWNSFTSFVGALLRMFYVLSVQKIDMRENRSYAKFHKLRHPFICITLFSIVLSIYNLRRSNNLSPYFSMNLSLLVLIYIEKYDGEGV